MTSHDARSQGANLSARLAPAIPVTLDTLAPRPITTLERFLELAFVFTITRLFELPVHGIHRHRIVQLPLILGASSPAARGPCLGH
jgi:hypothetical protein